MKALLVTMMLFSSFSAWAEGRGRRLSTHDEVLEILKRTGPGSESNGEAAPRGTKVQIDDRETPRPVVDSHTPQRYRVRYLYSRYGSFLDIMETSCRELLRTFGIKPEILYLGRDVVFDLTLSAYRVNELRGKSPDCFDGLRLKFLSTGPGTKVEIDERERPRPVKDPVVEDMEKRIDYWEKWIQKNK